MSDNESIFEALSILARQCRDLESRVAALEVERHDHHERLTAQSMLIAQLRRAPGVPSLHPVWRKEAA